LSRRIIETREARGEFANVAELREVSGLDDFMVTRLAHLVTV